MSSPYTPFPQGGDQGGYGQPYPQGGGWGPGTPQGYLQGGPVGFGEAISQAFKNILIFNGRASRSAYWWFALLTFIIALAVDIAGAVGGVKVISYIVAVVIFLVTLALQVRRLHDIDRSGFWWFIGLIPIVGSIVLLVFDCLPGTPGPNKFG